MTDRLYTSRPRVEVSGLPRHAHAGKPNSGTGALLGLLKVQREEFGTAALHLLFILFATGFIVMGRNVSAALFLSHYGSELLPWMYVASALALSSSAWFYARVTGRIRLDKLIIASGSAMAVMTTGLWLGMRWDVPLLYAVLYVMVEALGALLIIQFWSLANATHHTRQAKRLFGFIGAGGVIASILVGFGGAALAPRVGTENLIFVMVACLLACIALGAILGANARQQLIQALEGGAGTPRRPVAMSRQTLQVFHSRHLRTVAIIVALTFIVITLVDYQFKTLAAREFEEEALTAFFSLLYGIAGVIGLFVQLFVTARLIERFSVLLALLILPCLLLLGSVAVFLVPLAAVAAFAKGSDAVFRYSINDVTLQLLYLPVPARKRMKAKAFIDGVLKPLTCCFTGLALILAIHITPQLSANVHWLATISAGIAALWLWLVTKLRGEYLKSLVDTLHKRRLDFSDGHLHVDEASANKVLGTALQSNDDKEIMRALELLEHVDVDSLDKTVAALLDHHEAEIRKMALAHLGRRGSLQWLDSVYHCFEDENGAVRAAAIKAYCSIGRVKAVRVVRRYLDDPVPIVRAAAITGMIRWGVLDGILGSVEVLEEMISSSDPVLRSHGVTALGEAGPTSFYMSIVPLLGDEDIEVQRAAIAAAELMKSPELVPSLICKLGDARVGGNAADALVAYGPGIEHILEKVLLEETERPWVRLGIPGVLGRLGTQQAADILMGQTHSDDEELEARVCRWINRLHTRFPTLRVDQKALGEAVMAQIIKGYETLGHLEGLALEAEPSAEAALLAQALEERLQQVLDRTFNLLALRFPGRTMETVRVGLESMTAGVRGNAVEVLENTLDRRTRSLLIPLVDERPRKEKVAAAECLRLIDSPHPRDELLLVLTSDSSPWVRACALHYLATTSPVPTIKVGKAACRLLDSSNTIVREVALLTAATHLPPAESLPLLEAYKTDDVQRVSVLASILCSELDVKPLEKAAVRVSSRAG